MTSYTEKGITALKNGDKSKARSLLSLAVKDNPKDEKAWLALAAASEHREQRVYCLQKALSLNPENAIANRELSKIISPFPKNSQPEFGKNLSSKAIIAVSATAIIICLCFVALIVTTLGQSAKPLTPNTKQAIELSPTISSTPELPTQTAATPNPSPTRTSTIVPATETVKETSTSSVTQSSQIADYPCVPPSVPISGEVVGIIDGDTIDVNIGGTEFRVRYIGIDTPEKDQPFGSQATAYNQTLVRGQQVSLYKDISETDQYGRLLRYVFVGSLFVNYELVAKGYAEATDYPPDSACKNLFANTATDAMANQLGIWASSSSETSGGSGEKGNSDPSYPDVCIPPYPPDLNCDDVDYNNFKVVGSDPHNLDGNNDGWACEE